MSNPYSNDPTVSATDDMGPLLPKNAAPSTPPPPPAAAADVGDETIRQEEESEGVESQEEARTVKFAIGKLNDFLHWFIVVLEITLLIRFLFRLIGANPANVFAAFLYALTDIILYPFNNLLVAPSLHTNQAFEWSTLIAMLIYWLVFFAIRKFLSILITEPEPSST